VTILPSPDRSVFGPGAKPVPLILLVARAACERLLGGPLQLPDRTTFYLPSDLRQIAMATDP
jgi:hypothetical protein